MEEEEGEAVVANEERRGGGEGNGDGKSLELYSNKIISQWLWGNRKRMCLCLKSFDLPTLTSSLMWNV